MANKRKRYNNNLNISGNTIRRIRKERKLSREVLSNKLLLEEVDISAQSIAKNVEISILLN